MGQTTVIDTQTTTLSSIAASTPASFFSSGPTTAYTVAAILTAKGTTVTAVQVPGSSGVAVIDGTTLSSGQQGITLANGDVISIVVDGIEDKTTTAFYSPIPLSSSESLHGVPNPTEFSNPLTYTIIHPTNTTLSAKGTSAGGSSSSGATAAASGASTSASASSSTSSPAGSSNSGTAQSIGAGKALALVGALAGLVLCGL